LIFDEVNAHKIWCHFPPPYRPTCDEGVRGGAAAAADAEMPRSCSLSILISCCVFSLRDSSLG